tara:strand:+ start:2218 stop:2901 length:684 start_codon:yes stop_codon:yes gene_type:complete
MSKFTQETGAYLTDKPRMKDYYPVVYNLIESRRYKSVLDIGCASGDFINLMSNFDDVECIGVDISEELISRAKANSNNSNTKFLHADILEDSSMVKKPIDMITCFGTAIAIENLKLLIDRLISFQPKLIFLNDFINVNGLDVVVGYRRQEQTKFNYGYNIRSEETWRGLIKNFQDYSIEFQPYKMKSKLIKGNSPTRNYHSSIDGELLQRNGMDLIVRGYNILISRA